MSSTTSPGTHPPAAVAAAPSAPPARPAPATRERLLDAAAELFYREGVGIGVEALCQAAGVSKRSMYQLFDSKDAVIAASLDRWARTLRAQMFPAADDARPPRERILEVFEWLEAASADPDFRGCPFVGTAVEVKDPAHPAAVVARQHKQALTDFFAVEARRAGAPDPVFLAEQLTMIYDGASARAVVRAQPLAGIAVTTATLLLETAGVRD